MSGPPFFSCSVGNLNSARFPCGVAGFSVCPCASGKPIGSLPTPQPILRNAAPSVLPPIRAPPASRRSRPVTPLMTKLSKSLPQPEKREPAQRPFMRVAWINRKMNLHYRADPILRLLENVTGVRATLVAPGGGPFSLEDTDVFFVQASYLTDVRFVKANHGAHALFIFIAIEPLQNDDNRLDIADVSFGQAPWLPIGEPGCDNAITAPNFVRTPPWVLRVVLCSRGFPVTCQIVPSLLEGGRVDPRAWFERPGFALHISRHGGFPRETLLNAFMAIGRRLDASGPSRLRTADCPRGGGEMCPNVDWPADIPNDGQGKLDLTMRYRYAIQPENARTMCQGYMTEKVPEGELIASMRRGLSVASVRHIRLVAAFMSGAVPVYWGDAPDPSFWNSARMLVLESGSSEHVNALVERVEALETDVSARAAFFSELILDAGASAWVQRWCDKATRLLRDALLKHPVLRKKFPPLF